jgi:hypothetical protein
MPVDRLQMGSGSRAVALGVPERDRVEAVGIAGVRPTREARCKPTLALPPRAFRGTAWFPLRNANTGPARKFAVPSICRRYHSAFVSPSSAAGVNFSAPSAKCPQQITTYAHTLRSRFAAAFAVSVRRHCRRLSAGKSTVAARSCSECKPCNAIPHSNVMANNTFRKGCSRLLGCHRWSRATRRTPYPRSSSTPMTLVNTW